MRRIQMLAGIAMAMAATVAQAQIVVDQSDTRIEDDFDYLNNGTYEQTFTAGYNNSVGAGIYIDSRSSVRSSSNLTIELWTGTLDNSGATMLASGTTLASAGAWNDVSWDQVGLTAGTVYSLRFVAADYLIFDYSTGDFYTGGTIHWNGTDYGPYYDSNFKTYANAAPAPEPASWAMMLGGFGLIGGAMRVRRKAVVSFG